MVIYTNEDYALPQPVLMIGTGLFPGFPLFVDLRAQK